MKKANNFEGYPQFAMPPLFNSPYVMSMQGQQQKKNVSQRIKNISNNSNKNNKTVNNSVRAGDWICLVCHNLNFSFRNECNRCQMQTKKQNYIQNLLMIQENTQPMINQLQSPQANQSYNLLQSIQPVVEQQNNIQQNSQIQGQQQISGQSQEHKPQQQSLVQKQQQQSPFINLMQLPFLGLFNQQQQISPQPQQDLQKKQPMDEITQFIINQTQRPNQQLPSQQTQIQSQLIPLPNQLLESLKINNTNFYQRSDSNSKQKEYQSTFSTSSKDQHGTPSTTASGFENQILLTPPKNNENGINYNNQKAHYQSYQSPPQLPSVSPILKLFVSNDEFKSKENFKKEYVRDFTKLLSDAKDEEEQDENNEEIAQEKEKNLYNEIQQSIRNLNLDDLEEPQIQIESNKLIEPNSGLIYRQDQNKKNNSCQILQSKNNKQQLQKINKKRSLSFSSQSKQSEYPLNQIKFQCQPKQDISKLIF